MLFIKKNNVFKASQEEDLSLEKESFENEGELQKLIFQHPNILADDAGVFYYSVGEEVRLPTNKRIDNLLIDNNGSVIVVEDKLSKNPGVGRDVVAQILDYITDLKGYTYLNLKKLTRGKLEEAVKDIEEKSGKDIREAIENSVQSGKIKLFIAVDKVNGTLLKIFEMIKTANPDSRLFVVEKYNHGNTIKVTSVHKKPATIRPPNGEEQRRISPNANETLRKLSDARDFLQNSTDLRMDEPVLGDTGMWCGPKRNNVRPWISYTPNNGYKFSWQTAPNNDEAKRRFQSVEKDIETLCPGSGTELTHGIQDRFWLHIDNDRPLESILEVITYTIFTVGYTG